ncbi:MAG: glucose-6-phosphate dehydrogenase assembly protein OpcA [Opitutaceae bacterium]|jgi:hypothetical protein
MSEIFNALPGIEVPVGEISAALAGIWNDSVASGGKAPVADDMRAVQVNLVLHFGFDATPDDALTEFRTAVRFASRYPSRVVVLCPMREGSGAGAVIRAKIYGECFLGKSREDARCCEFVILNYSLAARRFLESQVSICLSSELPLYYWAHRFTANHRLADYNYLLTKARRFIFDSAHAPADALQYPWPNPAGVRDLAYARTLPIRQSIGQFLSRSAPERLVAGLRRVTSSAEAVHHAEGKALESWVRGRLVDCGAQTEAVEWRSAELPHGQDTCFDLAFEYSDAKRFYWRGNCHTGVSEFDADLGTGEIKLPSHISLLAPEHALAEAMFF